MLVLLPDCVADADVVVVDETVGVVVDEDIEVEELVPVAVGFTVSVAERHCEADAVIVLVVDVVTEFVLDTVAGELDVAVDDRVMVTTLVAEVDAESEEDEVPLAEDASELDAEIVPGWGSTFRINKSSTNRLNGRITAKSLV